MAIAIKLNTVPMSLPTNFETDLRPPRDPLARPDAPSAHGQASTRTEAGLKPFGEDGFSFFDLLDIVNPLQHIPIVSNIYRRITGDTIDPLPRVAGGALFGGAIGFAVSAVNAMVDGATGKDIGEHVLAFLGDPMAPEADEPASGFAYAADFPSGARDRGSAVAQPLETEAQLGIIPVTTETLPEIFPTTAGRSLSENEPETREIGYFTPHAAAAEPIPGKTGIPTRAGIEFPEMRAPGTENPTSRSSPPDDALGTIADDGGWFTLIMLQAMEKYEAGARLGGNDRAPKPTVSILQ